MMSAKQLTRKQKFKIEIVEKKNNRIKSTPQRNMKSEKKINNPEQKQLSMRQLITISKSNQLRIGNPQIDKKQSLKHIRSQSQQLKEINNKSFQIQQKIIKQTSLLNLVMKKQTYYQGLNTFQSIQEGQSKLNKIIEKKMQQKIKNKQATYLKHHKNAYSNYFYDLNIVKCQSITLIKSTNKNKSSMKPSKNMQKSTPSSVSRRKIKIANINTSRIMNFNMNADPDTIYMKKLKLYLDFLFKVNFSNKIYISMQLKECQQITKYKAYVGWGNNHQIIKYCLKNRFWIELVERMDDSDICFYWTPWPIEGIHNKQKNRDQIIEDCPLINIKKTTKIDEENLIVNEKLFLGKQSYKVQNFIVPDGYIIPFSQKKSPKIISNHLSNSHCITHKKKLFRSLFQYYQTKLRKNPFSVIPVTYNVTNIQDPQFKRFVRDNQDKQYKIWIVKPGQYTNRGEGICLAKTNDVAQFIAQGVRQSYVIQSYIDRPLLYNGRKFDVRHFMLVTSVNGMIKAYWFKQGYLRTSSQYFNLQNLSDKFIHLTNDAIQQHSKNYSSFQQSNKVSYSQFQRYLDTLYPDKSINFQQQILQQIKQIIIKVIKANYLHIDGKQKQANFQLFGIDFMIDRDLKPWLIQINQNPCLQSNCHLLTRLIHSLIQNTLRLCVDPLLPPLDHFPVRQRFGLNDHYLKSLKYQIIFDELIQRQNDKFYNNQTQ